MQREPLDDERWPEGDDEDDELPEIDDLYYDEVGPEHFVMGDPFDTEYDVP